MNTSKPENLAEHSGKFFVQIGPTFKNFLTFYPYKLKFETILDILKDTIFGGISLSTFKFFGGEITSQNGIEILNFYFRTFIWL